MSFSLTTKALRISANTIKLTVIKFAMKVFPHVKAAKFDKNKNACHDCKSYYSN